MKEKNLATRAARSGRSKEKLLLAPANGGRSAAELGLYFQLRAVRDTLADTEQGAGTPERDDVQRTPATKLGVLKRFCLLFRPKDYATRCALWWRRQFQRLPTPCRRPSIFGSGEKKDLKHQPVPSVWYQDAK